jgi:sulfite oxidase
MLAAAGCRAWAHGLPLRAAARRWRAQPPARGLGGAAAAAAAARAEAVARARRALARAGLGGAALLAAGGALLAARAHSEEQGKQVDDLGLPYYSRKDVAAHKRKEERIWVTYKDGVYDITEFVQNHPGGERILLAAGGAIDPFWAMYNQHMTKQVLEVLARHRIGSLYPSEASKPVDFEDPYGNEPPRAGLGCVRCQKPYNCETVIELIPDNWVTPTAMHYTRHHHPVPDIDPDKYRLVVAFEDANILQLSLNDLKTRFKKVEVAVTLQCAGNRRSELDEVAPTQGLHWDCGALSTSVWGGVLLRDVLEFAGMGDESALMERAGVEHIQFGGHDKPYDASVPVDKALSKFGDCLVAFEQNGQPIGREHGGPVRIVVPGHLAARSTKWTTRITASKNEAASGWQRGFVYKVSPSYLVNFDGVDPAKWPSVQETPVNSAVCLPRPGAKVDAEDGTVTVKGWALAGGGKNIIRVDVSGDGGETWQGAELGRGKEQKWNRAWAWTFFETELPIPDSLKAAGGKMQIVCRAVDSSCNQQPEHLRSVWNLRGILNNAYHRTSIEIVAPPAKPVDEPKPTPAADSSSSSSKAASKSSPPTPAKSAGKSAI